jgi:hypothetical protein
MIPAHHHRPTHGGHSHSAIHRTVGAGANGSVKCSERTGGTLRFYFQEAA